MSGTGQEKRFLDNLFSDMADLIPYLEDSGVTDVSVTESGEIIVKKFGKGKLCTGKKIPEKTIERIIFAAASLLGKNIDTISGIPKLEGVIPRYNARITGLLPPWVMRAQLTLRKPPEIIYTLEQYVTAGIMTREQYSVLLSHVSGRGNVLIGGSTGSGKTTLLNAVLRKMSELTPDDVFYIVEDAPELQCDARIRSMICVRPSEAAEAVRTALRWSPERIIFGEVRYGEVANELLKAWNTGHPGNATSIHADSCSSMIKRFEGLLREVIDGVLPDITETIPVCVHLKNMNGILIMDEILETQTKRSYTWYKEKQKT
jgi:type IV secretion system protein VirB11